MAVADWVASLVNAMLGASPLVVALLVKRLIAYVQRHRPLANRRFTRRHRSMRRAAPPGSVQAFHYGSATRTPGNGRNNRMPQSHMGDAPITPHERAA